MSEESKSLWGFPVVVSDAVPEGEIVFGRLPTAEEIQEHGSLEKAIEAQKREWAKIKNLKAE